RQRARGSGTAARAAGTAVVDDHQIDRRHPAIRIQPCLDPALRTSTCRANEELLLTRNSHLYRPVDLAGEIAGYGHEGIGSDARAEATARVLIDEAELVQFDAQHAGQRRICRALALQGAVEVAAPVFPVGHTGAGLQRMVRIA